jgi:membrane associated rhomboid family serine protease
MVFPMYDDNTGRRTFPGVNYVLIALNVLVFVFLQGAGTNEKFTYAFAAVPYEIVHNEDLREPVTIEDPLTRRKLGTIDLEPTPVSVYLTLLVSLFMHGDWWHLAGNMLFLWIFGDNVEDDLGHVRYVLFYLVCGVLASLAHVGATYAFGGNPYIPSLGASGAISGVMGGYILMHPHRRVTVLLFRILTQVPGYVAVGMWFVYQLILGITNLGGAVGGVAYAAHIGGFLAGLALVKLFAVGHAPTTWNRRAPKARTWY